MFTVIRNYLDERRYRRSSSQQTEGIEPTTLRFYERFIYSRNRGYSAHNLLAEEELEEIIRREMETDVILSIKPVVPHQRDWGKNGF
jgi:hypothetical protein